MQRNGTALGAFVRRLKGRLGAAKAVTAGAHKLARLVYWTLKHGTAYVRQTQEQYESQQRQRLIENLKRRAEGLGLVVSEAEKPAEAKSDETAGK